MPLQAAWGTRLHSSEGSTIYSKDTAKNIWKINKKIGALLRLEKFTIFTILTWSWK